MPITGNVTGIFITMSNFDPTDIQAHEKAASEQEKLDRITKRQEADDIKWLMSDPRGRRIMWGLLELTGVYRSSFTGNSETFFREGERNVGLKLVHKIHAHCPEKYATMTKEMNDDNQPTS